MSGFFVGSGCLLLYVCLIVNFFCWYSFEKSWLQMTKLVNRVVKRVNTNEFWWIYAISNKCFWFNFIMWCTWDKILLEFHWLEWQKWRNYKILYGKKPHTHMKQFHSQNTHFHRIFESYTLFVHYSKKCSNVRRRLSAWFWNIPRFKQSRMNLHCNGPFWNIQ